MRVLVTGAAGWVGKAVVEVLGNRHSLRLLDAVGVEGLHECVVGDVADFNTVVKAMEGVEGVVHLAIGVPEKTGRKDPDLTFDVTVKGTYNVFDAARQREVRRVVLMSSCAVVEGYPIGTYLHRDIQPRFNNLYSLSKWLQEVIAKYYADAHGVSVICLRPWGVVDSRLKTHKGGTPLSKENYYFGWVCRYDLAEACRAALEAPGPRFDVFHVMPTKDGREISDHWRVESVLGVKMHDFSDYRPENYRVA